MVGAAGQLFGEGADPTHLVLFDGGASSRLADSDAEFAMVMRLVVAGGGNRGTNSCQGEVGITGISRSSGHDPLLGMTEVEACCTVERTIRLKVEAGWQGRFSRLKRSRTD
jgi:hypothetical protein